MFNVRPRAHPCSSCVQFLISWQPASPSSSPFSFSCRPIHSLLCSTPTATSARAPAAVTVTIRRVSRFRHRFSPPKLSTEPQSKPSLWKRIIASSSLSAPAPVFTSFRFSSHCFGRQFSTSHSSLFILRDHRLKVFAPPMPHSYEDAVEKINGLQTNFAVLEAVRASGGNSNKNSLPEVIDFIKRTGYDPEDFDELNLIHVTGTKGKGSTCALTESILRHYNNGSGKPLKTGLYTSPHLMEVRERIRIDGAPLSQELFAKYFFEVWDRLDSSGDRSKPGYFRYLTVMAFHVFKQEKVDVGILEVGVGGAYDSTNIIKTPIVTGVAALGIDHVNVLGSTLTEIAWNKGGIFKKGVPAVSSAQPEEGLIMLKKRAEELQADLPLRVIEPLTEKDLRGIVIGLAGKHQVANAALASEMSKIWIERVLKQTVQGDDRLPKAFEKGLETAFWPGRGQIMIRQDKPKIQWFFDGAHTAESILVCSEWFKSAAVTHSAANEKIKRVLVFNCTGPRDGDVLLAPLSKLQSTVNFDTAVFTPAITFASNTYKGDLVNNNAPLDTELKTQHILANRWEKQVALTLGEDLVKRGEDDKSVILPSIEHTVNWMDDYVKKQLDAGFDRVQVLVTGSLHLVGGVQSVLGCDVV